MAVSSIIAEIDAQIAKLQQARALIAGTEAVATKAAVVSRGPGRPKGVKKGPGRPKGSKNAKVAKAADIAVKVAAPHKRKISPEGRKRIAAAMTQRGADRTKLAAAK